MGTPPEHSHRLLAHTADIGIEASAPAPAALMEVAAAALAEVMAGEPLPVREGDGEPISLEAVDLPALAFAWLNELVGLADVRHAVPAATIVDQLRLDEAGEATLRARAWFVPYAPAGPRPRHHVKSVSLHRLQVWPDRGSWWLTAYLDL